MFWPPCDQNSDSGILVIRSTACEGSGRLDLDKNWKKGCRFKRKGGTFRPPLASFVDQTKGFKMWWPFGVMGGKQERKKKEEGRERKRREKENERRTSYLFLCLPRRTTKEEPRFSTFCKVISSELMLQTSRFMCWDVKYVDSLIYFMKKG